MEEENKKKNTLKWKRGDLATLNGPCNVYKGTNLVDGSYIAIKSLNIPPNPNQAEKEIEYYNKNTLLFKELKHKNIVKYIQTDISEQDLQVDILLEYYPLGSIRNLIQKYGKFNEILVKLSTRQILEALAFIHSKPIVHKNLKSSNILLDCDVNIKLTDFGFFDTLVKDDNGEMIFKGLPNWTSPEVLKEGYFLPSSDIWSLGCTIIEMLTGVPPWSDLKADNSSLNLSVREVKNPPPLPKVSQALENFLKKCLAIDTKERSNAQELLADPFLQKSENDKAELEVLTILGSCLKNGFSEGFSFEKMENEIKQKLIPPPAKKEEKKAGKKQAKKSPPAKSPKSVKKSPAKKK